MRCLNDLIGDALDCPSLRSRVAAALLAADDAEAGRLLRAGVLVALAAEEELEHMRRDEREEEAAEVIFGPWAPRHTAAARAKRVQS